jgi:serine phosphatase RsbU (regulator of sigma subunit)
MEYEALKEYNKEDYLLFSIFLGAVLVMIVYNTLLFFTVRDKSYIPYIIYLVLSLLSVISLRGIGFQFLWPESGWLNAYTRIATPALATVFIYGFIRMFLNTKEIAPKWNRVIFILQCLAATVPIMMIPQRWDYLTMAADILMNLGLLILPIVAFAVGWVAYRKGYKPAKFYLVAFSFLLLGLVVQILKNLGVLGQTLFTEYFFQFGIVMEQSILSIALGDRINVFKDEKEAAQAEAIEALRENERLIAEQNRILEQKVAERTAELQVANHQLAEKNEDILSSIQYAKRIQTAILPATPFIQSYIPTASVFYRPKDIVSGDFYWFGVREGKVILAAVDCTGHGVPGAFMSVIGYNQLNRAINELGITDAGSILFELDRSVRNALHQDDAASQSKDGMDVSLCVVDVDTRTIAYAGANRPLWLYTKNEWVELKGDKFPIGGAQYENKLFTTQLAQLDPGDRVFLFSDGVVDQFGGPQRRKVTPKRLREWLAESMLMPCETQAKFVEHQFDDWKADSEQLDDVTLIVFEL